MQVYKKVFFSRVIGKSLASKTHFNRQALSEFGGQRFNWLHQLDVQLVVRLGWT